MQHIHLIGIGGTGLSAIALLLKERGYIVSGSDQKMSPLARNLQEQGITVHIGHQASNVQGATLVVRSSAIREDNPEVLAARAAGIPVLKRQDLLGEWMAGSFGIAIAGTHGKTTTSAMLAWVLKSLGKDPSYLLGGISKNLGENAHAGSGKYFVIEADEYDRMFLGLKPQMILLTIVEHDHPDCYPTPEDYLSAFGTFLQTLPAGGVVIANGGDLASMAIPIPAQVRRLTYGFTSNVDYQANVISSTGKGGYQFELVLQDASLKGITVSLQVPGRHNVLNALAVLAACHQLDLSLKEAAEALSMYQGTGRRFDLRGEALGVTIIDDYAHHPTEIRATLEAAHTRYPGRTLWVVWQPHTYSRLQTLQNDFLNAFVLADHVLVTDVYAAREINPDFSTARVVSQMPHPSALFTGSLKSTSDYLLEHIAPGDVLLVLSAGDADQISDTVLTGLKKREQPDG